MRKFIFLMLAAFTTIAANVSTADAQWRGHHRGGYYGGGYGFYRPAPFFIAPPPVVYQRRVYVDEGYCEIRKRRVYTHNGYYIRRVRVCY